MKRIHVLISSTIGTNELSFVYPIQFNRRQIESLGLKVKIFQELSSELYDCDVLIVSSIFARRQKFWASEGYREVFDFLEMARQKTKAVIWADVGDSTGSTHFKVLPYVDRYFKGALLKDRNGYLREYYAARVFSDYYHETLGITDNDAGEAHLKHAPTQDELDKVVLSWNQAFMNYNYIGYCYDTAKRRLFGLPPLGLNAFVAPKKVRSELFNCRVSANYSRKTVAYQREQVLLRLSQYASSKRVNRRAFYKEMTNTRAVISPFGWGEICYRDFEAVVAGALLVKPSCAHMDTWPNLYVEHETYLPFEWDFSDFETVVARVEEGGADLLELAQNAQERYRDYLYAPQGRQGFASRFRDLCEMNR